MQCTKLQHVLVYIDGHKRAWMKHQKPQKIESSTPADKFDTAWEFGKYWNTAHGIFT
jgi:hypothetical protein